MYYLVFLHITGEYKIYSASMLSFIVGYSPLGSVELLGQGADVDSCCKIRDEIMSSINSTDFDCCLN